MELDPRLVALGITVEEVPDAEWVLESVIYEDETQSGGNHNIYFKVSDVSGYPMGVECIVDWVGRNPAEDPPTITYTDNNGEANVPIYGNLDIHRLDGPYFARLGDPSWIVRGMGLPEHRHVNFRLNYVPKPVDPPTPPPPPSGCFAKAKRLLAIVGF